MSFSTDNTLNVKYDRANNYTMITGNGQLNIPNAYLTNCGFAKSSGPINYVPPPLPPKIPVFYYRFMSNDAYNTSYVKNWATGSASTVGAGKSDGGTINPVQTTNYITINGNTGASTDNASVVFGGSNSGYRINSNAFTVAFWFNSIGTVNTWLFNLQSREIGTSNDVNISFIQRNRNGTNSVFNDRWTANQYTPAYNLNTWHHFVTVVESGKPVVHYYDNVKNTSNVTYRWTNALVTNRFAMGYGACCEGYFADVRYYESALSSSDVNTLYTTPYSVIP